MISFQKIYGLYGLKRLEDIQPAGRPVGWISSWLDVRRLDVFRLDVSRLDVRKGYLLDMPEKLDKSASERAESHITEKTN